MYEGAVDQGDRLWVHHSTMDNKSRSDIPPPPPPDSSLPLSGAAAARALFQSKTSRGQDRAGVGSTLVTSLLHSRAISGINVNSSGKQVTVTTSSLDGKIIVWDAQSILLNVNAARLNI